MKKNTFVKSTFILIIGGFFTKLLGMIIKIFTTRIIGSTGMGLYSMVMPTFMIILALSQLGLPTALNVLVGEKTRNNKNLVIYAMMISLIIDLFIMIGLVYLSGFLSEFLLSEPRVRYGLLSIGFIMPFITISNMLRSYFFGKSRMWPHVITNILEDIVRVVLIVVFLPYFYSLGIEYAIAYIILTNIFSELTSIIVFIFLLPNFKITKKDLKPNKKNIKDMLNISLPSTASRIIGSLGNFLEPIIITTILLRIGYSNDFIIDEYGVVNGFVMQLVLLPSFFTAAISQALIPIISNYYVHKKYDLIKRKIRQAIFYSLLIGIPSTILFEVFPKQLLQFLFNTTKGVTYIRFIAPVCLFHYIQSPISSSLQAMSKAKISMRGTLIGMIFRTIILVFISFLHVGMWSLIIATSCNILFVTLYDLINVKKVLKRS